MKFVYALALLIASVTVFGANASTQTGIENELEELDLLISLDNGEYVLDGLVGKLRDALQNVVDRLKEKLAGKGELFEQFRAKIEEVQDKIRDLVKQGGLRLAGAIQQIREKLQALIKSVFDKVNGLSDFYEAEEKELGFVDRIVQRLRELVQRGLDRLKERLAKSKEIFEQVKDKITEIQEKLRELGQEFGIKALDKVQEVREKLRQLLRDVAQKITGAVSYQSANYGVEELPELLAQVKTYVLSDEGFIAVKGIANKVQSTNPIVNFVQLFINSQSDADLKTLLRELFESGYQAQQSIPVDLFTRVKDILETDEGLAEIRKYAENLRSNHPIVIHVAGLLESVSDSEIRTVIDEIFSALDGVAYSAIDQDLSEYYEGESILQLLGQRLREFARRALDTLESHVAQAKQVAEKVKAKIQDLKEKVNQLGQEAGTHAIKLYQEIRRGIQDVLKSISSSITGSAFYESEVQESLLQRVIRHVRDLAQRALNKLKERLGSKQEIFDTLKEKIADIQAKITELGKQVGSKATEALRALRQKLRELAQQVKDRLAQSSNYAAAEEDDEDVDEKEVDDTNPSLVRRLISRIRGLVQRSLDRLRSRLATQKEIFEEFKDKIEEVSKGLLELAKQTGKKALDNARVLRQKIQDLNRAVFQRLTGKSSFYEAELIDEEEESKTGIFTKIVQRVRDLAQRALDLIKTQLSKSKDLFAEFKEKFDQVTAQLSEIAKKSGRKALDAVLTLRDQIRELQRDILKRAREIISGSMYQADAQVDKGLRQIIEEAYQRYVQKFKELIQRTLESAKAKLAQSKELFAEFKDKVEEITNQLVALSKKTVSEAFKSIGELRQKVRDLLRDLKERVTGVATYEAEAEEEEVEQGLVNRIVQRVRSLVTRVLDRITEFVAKSKEVLPKVQEKIAQVTAQLKELGQKTGAKALEAAKALQQRLRELVKEVTNAVLGVSYSSYYSLFDNIIKIRDIVTTPEGLQRLKTYLDNLPSTNPHISLVRAYVQASSDEALLEILTEFFSGLSHIFLADFPINYEDLAQLFREVRDEITSDEGIQKLRDYARNLQTSHPVVSRIKSVLETAPTQNIRVVLTELFSGLNYALAL